MLVENGRIVALESDGAWVETLRQSTCGSCSARKGCGHGLLNEMGAANRNYVWVLPGDEGLDRFRLDDEVRIAIPEEVVLTGSFLVYVVPLVLMLAGAVLASSLPVTWPADLATIAGAVLGFAGGIGLVRLHARRNRDNRALQPRLLGRVSTTICST